jgi:prepilin-type N-terminal cleavage/methylation domain-containing protein
MTQTKKGFTLIELLIVIAIIGILASALLVSLGGARQNARDARRIGDLRQVQAGLELYYNKCGRYPGDSGCNGPSSSPPGSNPAGWSDLQSTLTTGSNLGIGQIPNDPSLNKDYRYSVETSPNDGQTYILGATLERDNAALKPPFTIPTSVLWGGINPICNPGNFEYCVGI